jgi:hypothetical protein
MPLFEGFMGLKIFEFIILINDFDSNLTEFKQNETKV